MTTHDRTALDAIKADRGRLTAALKDAGGRFVGDKVGCPFHEDDRPSGSVHQAGEAWLYTCHGCTWNDGKRTGDIVAVFRANHGCDHKSALDRLGVNGTGAAPSTTGGNGHQAKPKPSTTDIAAAQKLAADSAARLQEDSDARDRLWRTRGIDAGTAKKLGLGVIGESGRRHVTMPITDARGKFVAIKEHGLDGQTGSDKGKWHPAGTDKPTQHPFPVSLTGDGPVWIGAPLEAAAIIGLGLPAIGYTGGEAADLPAEIIRLLKSAKKPAALPADDDKAGAKWGKKTLRKLDDADINARLVDLDLDKSAGLKDIGDFIVRELIDNVREPDGVRESLLHAYEQSDPWQPFTFRGIITSAATWEPTTHIGTGLTQLDELAGGGLRTKGVHLFVGKPGQAKTTLAVQIAGNAALAGVSVGVVSLELMRGDLSKLILAQQIGIPRSDLDSGRVDDGYQLLLGTFKRDHANAPLIIVDDDHWDGGLDRDKLASLVAEGVKRFGWRLVVLDYLGLLAPGPSDRGEFESDLLNSTAIKKLASRYDIAMVVVAALRKAANFKKPSESKKISLDDVSGAGRLTYDCTSCWFIEAHQEWGNPPSGILKLHCLKSRFTGAASLGEPIELHWTPRTGQVSDLRYHE